MRVATVSFWPDRSIFIRSFFFRNRWSSLILCVICQVLNSNSKSTHMFQMILWPPFNIHVSKITCFRPKFEKVPFICFHFFDWESIVSVMSLCDRHNRMKIAWKSCMQCLYIENDAYVSNFIMPSQEEKVTNEMTGLSTIVWCDWTMSILVTSW